MIPINMKDKIEFEFLTLSKSRILGIMKKHISLIVLNIQHGDIASISTTQRSMASLLTSMKPRPVMEIGSL